jgi:hypothetical protein
VADPNPTIDEQIDILKLELTNLKTDMTQEVDEEFYSGSGELRSQLQDKATSIKQKEKKLAVLLLTRSRQEMSENALKEQSQPEAKAARKNKARQPPRKPSVPGCDDPPCVDTVPGRAVDIPAEMGCVVTWDGMEPSLSKCGELTLPRNPGKYDNVLLEIGKKLKNKLPNAPIDKWKKRGIKLAGSEGDATWTKCILMMAAAEVIENYWTARHKDAKLFVTSHRRDDSTNHRSYAAMDYHIQLVDKLEKVKNKAGEDVTLPTYMQRLPAIIQWVGQRLLINNGKLPNGGSGMYLNVFAGFFPIEHVAPPDTDKTVPGTPTKIPTFIFDGKPAEGMEQIAKKTKDSPYWGPGTGHAPLQQAFASVSKAGPGGSGGIHYDLRHYAFQPKGGAGSKWLHLDLDSDGKDEITKTRESLKYLKGDKVSVTDNNKKKLNWIRMNDSKPYDVPQSDERGDKLGWIATWYSAYGGSQKVLGPQAKKMAAGYFPITSMDKIVNLDQMIQLWVNRDASVL